MKKLFIIIFALFLTGCYNCIYDKTWSRIVIDNRTFETFKVYGDEYPLGNLEPGELKGLDLWKKGKTKEIQLRWISMDGINIISFSIDHGLKRIYITQENNQMKIEFVRKEE